MGRNIVIKKHLALWVIGIVIVSCLGGCGYQDKNAVIQDRTQERIIEEASDEQPTEAEGNIVCQCK